MKKLSIICISLIIALFTCQLYAQGARVYIVTKKPDGTLVCARYNIPTLGANGEGFLGGCKVRWVDNGSSGGQQLIPSGCTQSTVGGNKAITGLRTGWDYVYTTFTFVAADARMMREECDGILSRK